LMGVKKVEVLRAIVILIVMLGISTTRFLVHKDTPGERLILIAINVATFATIPIIFRIWPIPGKKEISLKRWGAFLVIAAVGQAVIIFPLTRPWLERHPRVDHMDEVVSHFNYVMGGWLA